MLKSKEYIEIELLNKKRVLIEKDWDKVYDLSEKTCIKCKLALTFPFLKIEKKNYVSFKFRSMYETINDFMDPRYKVNCTLIQFARLFDVKIKSFEESIVENDINYDK